MALLGRSQGAGIALSPTSEAALVERATIGDATAFARLYDFHVNRVYRFVYYQVGSHAEAEDLTQQAFLQAWHAIGSYRQTGSPFIAWLLTVAHNVVVGSRRRSQREAKPRARERKVATIWDTEAEALAGVDRARLREAITRLKPDQQQVIMLRFVERFGYAEIAAAMGKSEGNIRVIQHRALSELRRLLVGEEQES